MKIRIFDSIQQIGERNWKPLENPEFLFTDFKYLSALERSGSLGDRTGWQPHYITCWSDTDLETAVVTYLKNNSYGEYIFDFAWANAYQSVGLNYYPKLVAAIPFTPATGPKILSRREAPIEAKQRIMEALEKNAKELETSSIHALFISQDEIPIFRESNYEIRHSYQFHWRNRDFKNFEDFLSHLKPKRRKEISRERKQVSLAELKISVLTGDQLTPAHAEMMFQFYYDTTQKMGGHTYLTQNFFKIVFEEMKEKIVFIIAENSKGQAVAGALNYQSHGSLFGRYWGCLAAYKFLHFELCYYRTIEYAIHKKLKLFEAGAQGEHKFQRGFLPSLTYSAHKIFDPRFQEAISNFIAQEKKQIDVLFQEYENHNPFRPDII
jgi:predicted N-acyltransferase